MPISIAVVPLPSAVVSISAGRSLVPGIRFVAEFRGRIASRRYVVDRLRDLVVASGYFAFRTTEGVRAICAKYAVATSPARDRVRGACYASKKAFLVQPDFR